MVTSSIGISYNSCFSVTTNNISILVSFTVLYTFPDVPPEDATLTIVYPYSLRCPAAFTCTFNNFSPLSTIKS